MTGRAILTQFPGRVAFIVAIGTSMTWILVTKACPCNETRCSVLTEERELLSVHVFGVQIAILLTDQNGIKIN